MSTTQQPIVHGQPSSIAGAYYADNRSQTTYVLSVLVMRPQCLHEILSVPVHLYVRSRQNVILQVMKVRQRPRNNGTERFITYYTRGTRHAASLTQMGSLATTNMQ